MKPMSDARSNASRRGRKTQWKKVWLALAVILTVTAATALAAKGRAASAGDDGQGEEGGVYAIGLWGDLPYSDTQALVGVPNMIADMNSQDLAFTAHDGDLKAGSGIPGSTTITTCADGLYTQALGYFNSLRAPAIFTPGDNDWTDCDRPANGALRMPSLRMLERDCRQRPQTRAYGDPQKSAYGAVGKLEASLIGEET
jgi:hypothetical protein